MTDDNEDMITIEELNKVLKHAKNRKSGGLDNLPMELWKFGGDELKMHILERFNKIIDKNQMPQEWETGMVINVHEKGTKSKPENYREITLLPTAYKLFANVIKIRLNEHLEDEMVEGQCGFRKGRSCIARAESDGTRAETRIRISPKRTSPFKSVGASVQLTAGSRSVRIGFSNDGYTTFGGGLRVLATHSIRQFPLHFPSRASPCATKFRTSSTDAVFTVQQIIEKRKEHNSPLFLLFIYYEKTQDNVNRDKLWKIMDNKIPNYLLNTIKGICRNTKVRINL